MKRHEMIKDRKLFNSIIKESNFNKNKYFVIYIRKNNTSFTNFGIAISKKYGNAVNRNEIKRKVRAIIDQNRNMFQNGFDYIIMIRKSCENIEYKVLENELTALLKEWRMHEQSVSTNTSKYTAVKQSSPTD